MSEEKIYKLLSNINSSEKNLSTVNPLDLEMVNVVTKNITNIIYGSFKQKSSSSSFKRGNLLEFINHAAEIREDHLNLNISFILQLIDKNFDEIESEQRDSDMPNLENKVVTYYKKLNSKYKERSNHIEFIKNFNQRKMASKYQLNIHRKLTKYEMKDSTIVSLFHTKDLNTLMTSVSYKKQQIKVAYALTNLKTPDCDILKKILLTLATYDELAEFQQEFLLYLWKITDSLELIEILVDNFFFIIERIILKHATNIVQLNNTEEVDQYTNDLATKQEVLQIQNCCKQVEVCYKLKQLIYELYCFSFCNENVLKLCNIFNIKSK